MSARRDAANAAWTPERRERQREVAKRLVAEGKFGGRQPSKGGGRPHKRAPSAEQLLLVFEHVLRPAAWSWPDAQAVVHGRHALGKIAHALGIDRPQMQALLVSAVATTIREGQLPEFVLIRDGTVTTPTAGTGAHASQTLRRWRSGNEAKHLVVLRELSNADVSRYSEQQIVEALVLLQFITSNPTVRTTIAVAMADLGGRVREAVEQEIHRRKLQDER